MVFIWRRPTHFCLVAVTAVSLLWSPFCNGHGYTTISRNLLCTNGDNDSCGSIIYEPQSLEAPKGFPGAGPVDGKLASAGIPLFSALDEQTPYRWAKTNVQQGPFDVTWLFTANHRTTGYEYYITKPDWDPNAPLTRSQLNLTPFCTVNGGGVQPPMTGVTHTCNLPARSGYHVILAVWIIHDTSNAFYNAMDVEYGGPNPPPPPPPPTTPAPVAAPTATPAPTTLAPVVPAPSSPTPPTLGALCSLGLPLEAVNDCTAFVYCSNNGAIVPGTSPVPCASGLLFNNNAQSCDWDYNVNCSGGNASSPPIAPTPPPIAPTPPPTTPSPVVGGGGSGAVCSSGQSHEPVENCTAFVQCVNGAVVPNSQTYCPHGLLFSATTLVCDWPSNVHCNS